MKVGTPLVLPPALLTEVEGAPDEEHRRGLAAGLPDNVLPLTDAYRHILREKIAEGIRSLREGSLVDGESFMAEIDAELAALERQGH